MQMKWQKKNAFPVFVQKETSSWPWKVLGVFGLLLSAVMAVIAWGMKKKNEEYRDALIRLSDQLPEEEWNASDAKQRRESWQSAHAPDNRKTVEERLEDQRIREGM